MEMLVGDIVLKTEMVLGYEDARELRQEVSAG